MVTMLIICIPVSIAITGFLVLKSVHLALRWKIETKESKLPTMDSPIKPIIENMERKEDQKAATEQYNLFDEWVNGEKEG